MRARVCVTREQLLHALSDTLSAGMHPNELVLAIEQFIDAKVESAIVDWQLHGGTGNIPGGAREEIIRRGLTEAFERKELKP